MTTPHQPQPHTDGWQPVKGYEGRYDVSTCGTIRRADGFIVGQWPNSDGYSLARLSNPRAVVRVHRVVAEAFLPNDSDLPNVNHIDCNRSNNDVSNLEWCTQQQNLEHMDKLGRRAKHWLGKRSPNAHLTEHQVRELRRIRSQWNVPFSRLAQMFGVSKRAAMRCAKGEVYEDVR